MCLGEIIRDKMCILEMRAQSTQDAENNSSQSL